MMSGPLGGLLADMDAAPPSDLLAVMDKFLSEAVAATGSALFLVDYDLKVLSRLTPGSARPDLRLRVTDGPAGTAFLDQRPTTEPLPDGPRGAVRVYAPVTVRGERLGLLQLDLPGPPPAELATGLDQLTTVLGHVVLSAARYTDLFERARRANPLTLPAELQWSQLPVRGFQTSEFAMAAQLVPAYDVGGDNFDYSVDGDLLQLSAVDAMGHGLHASLLSTLAVTSLRHGRRAGAPLPERARLAHRALHEQFGGERFVAAVLIDIDLSDGTMHILNAGQPGVYRFADDQLQLLPLTPQLPFGLFPDTEYQVDEHRLRPGDRLVVVSDGLLEAVTLHGRDEFGEDRLAAAVAASAHLPPFHAVALALSRLEQHGGGWLRDDATVIVVDWVPSAHPG